MTRVDDAERSPARDPDPDPPCPVRVGDLCKLCVPGASGPENCGLVYLVTCDPELLADLLRRWG